LREIKDARQPSSYYQLERKESMQKDPNCLYGIVGTTAEDRRRFPPKNYREELRIASQLQKKYSYSICSVKNKKSKFVIETLNLSNLYDKLAEITSLYPNVSDLGIFLHGYRALEGSNMKKKIRDFLFTINKFRIDTFWKILLIEPIIKKMNNQRYQTEDWSEIHLMLRLIGNPILFDSYIEERYPDKSSKDLFIKRGSTFISNHIRISLIAPIQKINIPKRKKGHNDKGSSQLIRKKKTKEIYSYERTYYSYPEYIDKEGYYMEPEKKLEENLYNIMVKSTERYLEWLKQQPKEIQEKEAQKLSLSIEKKK